jgi:hypothetical protein
VNRLILATLVLAATLASFATVEACGRPRWGEVDDLLEAATDAQRIGDFSLAHLYATLALDEARKVPVHYPEACGATEALELVEQTQAQLDFVAHAGRSEAALDRELAIPKPNVEATYAPAGTPCYSP